MIYIPANRARRRQQTPFDEFDLRLRCGDASLRLLLKAMQHVYRLGKLHRVNAAVSVALIRHDDFQYAHSAEAPQRLGAQSLFAALS
jgi:hypothetical protein